MSTDKQSSDSPADQIAREWLDPLPWATPEELRGLVESEHAAAFHSSVWRADGIPQRLVFEPVAFDVFALVLAEVHGEPAEWLA